MSKRILVVDDDDAVAAALQRQLKSEGYDVDTVSTGEEGLRAALEQRFDLVISDLKLAGLDGLQLIRELCSAKPELPVVLMTAFGSTNISIQATKFGAVDFLAKPFAAEELLQTVRSALANSAAGEEAAPLAQAAGCEREIAGRSKLMQTVFREIGRLAAGTVTVIVQGESGTGKELVARALHQYSDRENQPFVPVNCMAIPEALLESELFGHERGAFTGAVSQRIGRFEQANGGTLFLDEIGDISLSTQGKLLRVLQDKCIQRVGGKQSIPVNVRIVAATNRDLVKAIQEKQFREDLYYRLAGGVIFLPALRDRKSDIPILTEHFIRRYRAETGANVSISLAALQVLEEQSWPGNVRELENTVLRAILLARGRMITKEIVRETLRTLIPLTRSQVPTLKSTVSNLLDRAELGEKEAVFVELVATAERELLTQALERAQGNQSVMSRWLGLSRPTIHQKLQRYGLLT